MSKTSKLKEARSGLKQQSAKLMNPWQIERCNAVIHTATAASAAAGAIPIPVADAIPITAAQVTMVIALGRIFGVKISKGAAGTILTGVAAPIVGRTIAGSFLKFIPIAGWLASAALAALITEVIGWTVAVDFAKDYKKREIIQGKEKEHAKNVGAMAENEIMDDDEDDMDEEIIKEI
jgi:uncharacterized protein (DUF697 family)